MAIALDLLLISEGELPALRHPREGMKNGQTDTYLFVENFTFSDA